MSGTRTTVLVFADGARLTMLSAAGLRSGWRVGPFGPGGRRVAAVVDRDANTAARAALAESLAVGQLDSQAVR